MARRALPPRVVSAWGFTLIELLIVSLIASVLLTVGVSSFNHFIRATEVDTVINRLRTALSLARGESVRRSQVVMLCRMSISPGACAGTAATGQADWSEGWLLFVDRNRDRQLDLADGDELIRTFPPLEEAYLLKWNRGDFIAYQANGTLFSLNGTFCLGDYDDNSRFRRELAIPASGRVRASRDQCSYTLLP